MPAIRAVTMQQGDGKTYYVAPGGNDSADGSKQHPWATITHAAKMISPGSRVVVASGTYNEQVVTAVSGTESARITYVAEHKWEAVIAPASHGSATWKNTGDWSDVSGFMIAGTDCNGIAIGGSHQRVIKNNVHNSADGCPARDGGSGIDSYSYTGGNNEILSNYVHDVGSGDSQCGQSGHRSFHGIYVSNPDTRVSNNISVKNCVFGIHLWHAATHDVVTNNTVLYNRGGGILIGSGDSPCTHGGCPNGNDNTVVRNNIIAYNGNPALKGWGIVESTGGGGKAGAHNDYSHNLTYHNVGGDFALSNHLTCANCIQNKEPLLVAPDRGDFRLRPGSPAIGSGTKRDAPNEDYDGHPRSSADIGASAASSSPR